MTENVPHEDRLTLGQVIFELQSIVEDYPDMVDWELEVNDEFGELFYVVGTDIQNGPWLIIREAIDKTPQMLKD